jgi:hypothetical protein
MMAVEGVAAIENEGGIEGNEKLLFDAPQPARKRPATTTRERDWVQVLAIASPSKLD